MYIQSTSARSRSPSILVEHYTDEEFFILQRLKVKNGWVKPNGGLWVSPVESVYGWKEWCADEDYPLSPYRIIMELSLERNLLVDEYADLDKITWVRQGPHFYQIFPDFEKMAEQYDTIWLTRKGEIETRLLGGADLENKLYGAGLYGWDCESILVMNERAVQWVRQEAMLTLAKGA